MSCLKAFFFFYHNGDLFMYDRLLPGIQAIFHKTLLKSS